MNIQKTFGANLQPRIHQQVQRIGHHSLGRVLDGHDAERNPPAGDILKNFRDAGGGQKRRRGAEFSPRGQMRIARFGAEERDFQGRFETAASRNDFPKNGLNGWCWKRTAVEFGNSLENFLLTAGDVDFLVG